MCITSVCICGIPLENRRGSRAPAVYYRRPESASGQRRQWTPLTPPGTLYMNVGHYLPLRTSRGLGEREAKVSYGVPRYRTARHMHRSLRAIATASSVGLPLVQHAYRLYDIALLSISACAPLCFNEYQFQQWVAALDKVSRAWNIAGLIHGRAEAAIFHRTVQRLKAIDGTKECGECDSSECTNTGYS